MVIIKIALYGVIGATLASAGVIATSHWQFWVVIMCVMAIEMIAYFRK